MERQASYRFRKENRLPDSASFDRVFEKAERSRDKWFTVLARTNNNQLARLGLAISKKHCKKASGRNRIKRIVRESFRRNLDGLVGCDVIVMNKPAAAAAANSELDSSLEMHWQRCREKVAKSVKNNDNNQKNKFDG